MSEGEEFPTEPCANCQQAIIMTITPQANRLPVEPAPADRGNVVLEWRGGTLPLSRVVGQPRAGLRVSHMCKAADQNRRRGGR